MKRLLTAAEMRAVDAAADGFGMPSAVLMENAGEALAREALAVASPHGRFLVVCGTGNNGGDGLVAARRLAGQGREVFVELLGAPGVLKGEPARNWTALEATRAVVGRIGATFSVVRGDVVIDALFGTGLSRPPEGAYADAIARMAAWRAAGALVVAADVPSGLDSDTGRALEPTVTADVTVSFGYLKLGQAVEPGVTRCGRVVLADIGIPRGAERALSEAPVSLVEAQDARARLHPRRSDSHKGTYGHVLVVAGSTGKSGAAALCALGALRGGAGLVTVASSGAVVEQVLHHAPEVMGEHLGQGSGLGAGELERVLALAQGKQALVIGPGLERGPETAAFLAGVLAGLPCPAVLDADALNALAADPAVLRTAAAPVVVTPHPGEMARLLGASTADVQAARLDVARTFSRAHGVIVVLKGARTLTATPTGSAYVNPTGNPGMATGGSGDVLAGLIGALIAQGLPPEDAALTGVWAHGHAGDLAAARRGQVGLIASDLLDGLGETWAGWGR